MITTLKSKDELFEQIAAFQKENVNVFMNHIFFNGHGNRGGSFEVYNKVGGTEYVDLIDFLNEVLSSCTSKLFDHSIEVVFGQCHAHLYKEKDGSDPVLKNPNKIPISIACFTHQEKPFTHNEDIWLGDELVSWKHVELQKHAEDRATEINLPADLEKLEIKD